MMKHILCSLFILSSIKAQGSVRSTIEILRLPAENRKSVVQEKGSEIYSQLIEIAFDEKQLMNVRWRALIAASEAVGDKAILDLQRAGDHSEWFMRNAALLAMVEINPSEANKLAKKLIKDKALVVRSAAVQALDNSNTSPEVRDILWDELGQKYNFKNEQSLWIRHQILEVLSKNPRVTELPQFAKFLSDKDEKMQEFVVLGLEKITGRKMGSQLDSLGRKVGMWRDHLKHQKLAL